MRALSAYLNGQKIGLIDVGASGGLEPRWLRIKTNIKAFLFEPDERSQRKLELADHIEKVFPIGLGSTENDGSINLCRKPGVSSLLAPRYTFLTHFPDSERFDVMTSETIKISTLDKCLMAREQDCDFIKLDTQGTELDILKGGAALLDCPVIGLEIEVEFIQLYENQPLFGEVCSYLEEKGYEFFDFVNICRWERKKFTQFGQAIFGDGLFLRTPEVFKNILATLPPDIARSKAKKYIAIAALYDHIDLLPACMENFNQFLEVEDLKAIRKLHAIFLRRRRITSFLLRLLNLFLRPLGVRTIGLQYS